MKHILIYSDCGGQYGAEQINHSLAAGFHSAGYFVSFAQPRASHALVRRREALGIVHHWLPEERLYELGEEAPSLRDAAPAAAIFGQVVPDLVLFADGCPFSSLAAKDYCRHQGIGFVVLVHCVFEGWQQDYSGYSRELARCYRAALEVIAVSQDNLTLLRRCFGLDGARGRVIHNGRPRQFFAAIDGSDRARVRSELGIEPDAILCLGIGRMELVKGYQYQLQALRHMMVHACWPSLRFLWVGSGTRQQQLVGLARLLSRDRITHHAEHDDIPALLAAGDMLVHTPQFEGMPLVILEAMARGLPVVATAVSGIPEALGDTGVLLEAPGTSRDLPREIANAVCALAADPGERVRLGHVARRRAQDLFQEDDMVRHYLDLIARLTGRTA